MTTGKKLLPLIISMILMSLLIFSILVFLPSCNKISGGHDESDDALSMLLEIVESNETTAESDYYVVVIPSDSTSALVQKANRLSEKIEEITGVESVVEYDNGDNPKRDNAIEIILGNADRNESKIALAKLRAGDYVCKKIDGNIVIGGVSDEATILAVDRFMSEILPYSSSEQLMSSGAAFEHIIDYPLDDVRLCGFPIKDFSIVCELDGTMLEIAKDARQSILDSVGYELNISSEQKDGVKEIVLELDKSENVGEGYIIYDGEDVALHAYDVYGMQATLKYFFSVLLVSEQTDEVCLNGSWVSRTIRCPNSLIEMEHITFDEDGETFVSLDCISAIINEIYANTPDLILISEMSESLWNIMRLNLPDGYACEAFGDTDVVAIVYDTSVIELSAEAERDGELTSIDLLLTEIGNGPSYRITYLYSDTADTADNISSKINNAVSENVADIVFVERALDCNDEYVLPEGSLLPKNDRIYGFKNGCVYIDAFSTQLPINFGDISGENLKGNGTYLGFLCHATRISFNRSEFIP